jgi:CBS domain containing-hemolysin-like protein
VSELDRLKRLFDFTDEDLAANRSGVLSARQRQHYGQRLFKQRVDKYVSLLTFAMFVLSLIIFIAFSLNYAQRLGPMILVAIVIWLAIVFILAKLIQQVANMILRLKSNDETKYEIDNPILKQATGRLQFTDDGEHRYVMLDSFELANSAVTDSQTMVWQLEANQRYTIYYVEQPFWIVAVEPASA